MRDAAKRLEFELAAVLRDEVRELRARELRVREKGKGNGKVQ